MPSYEEIVRIKESVEQEWLGRPGVTGIAVAKKRVNDARTPEFAIVVYVSTKKALSEISAAELIPSQINGVKTDVVERESVKVNSYKGGIEIQSEYDRSSVGSLGCFGFTIEPNPRPVLLTNQHVVLPFQQISFSGGEVGPKICSCCSSCCSTVIGILHAVKLTDNVDGAIALVRSKTSILFEVTGIGLVKGTRPLTDADVTNNIPLKMYSVMQKRIVTGTLETITSSGPVTMDEKVLRNSTNQIGILGDPATPAFGEEGDSGNMVFDNQNFIVGLLFGGVVNGGYACPIRAVESELQITIGKATQANQPFVVPVAAGIPSSAQPILNYPLSAGQSIEVYEVKMKELYSQIMKLPAGKHYHDLFIKHRIEVRGLVNGNKKVAATWHRNKGPVFMHAYYRNLLEEDFVFPKEIEGVSLKGLFNSMAAILLKFGSSSIKNDLINHLQDILRYVDECNTKKELLTKLAEPMPALSTVS
jgi:hypothetical protein